MYQSIVVGTDGSDTAKEAVRAAAELARKTGAKLHIVSAFAPVPESQLRRERRDAPSDAQWSFHAREEVDALLDDAKQEVAGDDLEVETHAQEGDPSEALIQAAEDHNADLIVVGNKGMPGAKRFLLGSVPNKVSHSSPTSVLIMRTT
jgi:nucleotide-binding universal stress UspA family protein